MEMVFNELRKYKTLLIVYTTVCILTAVFVSPFFGVPGVVKTHATDTDTELNFSEGGDVPLDDTLGAISNKATIPTFKRIAGSYAPIVGSCCEPFAALLFIGILDLINQYTGTLEMDHNLLGTIPMVIILAVFFILSKVMKCNEATKLFGLCTVGQLEKYLGLVFCIVLGIVNVVSAGRLFSSAVSAAGFVEYVVNSSFIMGLSATLFSVLMSVGSLIIYIIVKTVFFGIDTLQSCFAYIPFSGAVFEVIKTVFTITITYINLRFPYLAIVVDIILFLISLLFFEFFITVEEFLRKIYIKPFIARIKGFNDEIPLVSKRLPKKIRRFVESEYGNINLAIPAYSFKRKEAADYKMTFMQKIWIVSTENETIFFKKPFIGKMQKYMLTSRDDDKEFFMRKEFRFIEIFSHAAGDKVTKKDLRVIFSVEYLKRFEEIVNILGITDYHVYKINAKLTKKEQRAVKREERKEKIKERISAFTDKAAERLRPAYVKVKGFLPFSDDDSYSDY